MPKNTETYYVNQFRWDHEKEWWLIEQDSLFHLRRYALEDRVKVVKSQQEGLKARTIKVLLPTE